MLKKSWERGGWPDEDEEIVSEEPELNSARIDYEQYAIPPKEQIDMFRRLRQMDQDSKEYRELRNEIVMANLGLVYKVFGETVRMSSTSLEVDQILSYGVEGLCTAVDLFDPDRGYSLSTIAYNYIRKQFQAAIAECGFSITLSPDRARDIRKFHAVQQRLTEENLGVAPTIEEIAEECKWSVRKTADLARSDYFAVSLDEKRGRTKDGDIDDDVTLGGLIPDTTSDFVSRHESEDMVNWVCDFVRARFNEKAQEIFFLKLEDPDISYAKISRQTGINPETVRTIYLKMVEYLRYVLKHGGEPETKNRKKKGNR